LRGKGTGNAAVKQNIQVGDKKPVDQGRIGSFFGWLDGCGPIAFGIAFAPHETVLAAGCDDGKIYGILRGMAELRHRRPDRTERDNGQPSLPSDSMTQDANGNRGLPRGRMHRALDLILLLVALSGGLLALQNGRQLRQLRVEGQ